MSAPVLRYRARSSLRLSDSGFLMDMSNAESYTLNDSGRLIVQALLDGRPSDTIYLELVEQFEVGPNRAQQDVDSYLNRLLTLELVRQESTP